eukprot:TRINITY_DN3673_c0_g2_i6.p1 TRINITY_DN3673_c0_g2~~TRINITY_DN3673_c0_g2_i6.p1  ORF type:complete len:451 (+),score=238.07 TRINITY_DN3673_c0_g2_i6:132-1355(+)
MDVVLDKFANWVTYRASTLGAEDGGGKGPHPQQERIAMAVFAIGIVATSGAIQATAMAFGLVSVSAATTVCCVLPIAILVAVFFLLSMIVKEHPFLNDPRTCMLPLIAVCVLVFVAVTIGVSVIVVKLCGAWIALSFGSLGNITYDAVSGNATGDVATHAARYTFANSRVNTSLVSQYLSDDTLVCVAPIIADVSLAPTSYYKYFAGCHTTQLTKNCSDLLAENHTVCLEKWWYPECEGVTYPGDLSTEWARAVAACAACGVVADPVVVEWGNADAMAAEESGVAAATIAVFNVALVALMAVAAVTFCGVQHRVLVAKRKAMQKSMWEHSSKEDCNGHGADDEHDAAVGGGGAGAAAGAGAPPMHGDDDSDDEDDVSDLAKGFVGEALTEARLVQSKNIQVAKHTAT